MSTKHCRQSPEGLPQPDLPKASLAASPEGFAEDASRSHLTFAWDSQSHESPCNLLGFSIWQSPFQSIQDGTAWMGLYFKITLALTAPITLQHHHQS